MAIGTTSRAYRVVGTAAFILSLVFSPSQGFTQENSSSSIQREHVELRLVSASSTLGETGEITAGLDVRLAPGWMFYHETPGEFGIAPDFDWSASDNVQGIALHWPEPYEEVYDTDPPISTFGYKDAVLLPLDAQASDINASSDLRLRLDYAVCDDFCIFDHVELTLVLEPGAAVPTEDAERLQAALNAK